MTERQDQLKIVSIAGGTGRFSTLEGFRTRNDVFVTAVYNITDSGGSSGILRTEHGVLPPGDGVQAMSALAIDEDDRRFLLNRFFEGRVNGHRVSNLMYAAATREFGGDLNGVNYLKRKFPLNGDVLPGSLENGVDFEVELEDGSVICGETCVDTRGSGSPIKRAWLSKDAYILPDVEEAIKQADVVLFGPGDLWTSTIALLLIRGLPEAISHSSARKIMICNLVNKEGETDNYKASDYARVLTEHLGTLLDDFIVNGNGIDKEVLRAYTEAKQPPVEIDEECYKYSRRIHKISLATIITNRIWEKGRVVEKRLLRHHPEKAAAVVVEVVKQTVAASPRLAFI